MAINNQNQTIDFSVFTSDVEKKNVFRHLIKKQVEFGKFMANLYPNNNVYCNHAIMMNAVEKSNFLRFLSEILNGTMKFSQFSQIFVSVLEFLDDYYYFF